MKKGLLFILLAAVSVCLPAQEKENAAKSYRVEKNESATTGSAQSGEQAVDADALTVLEATKSGFVRKVNVFGTVVTGETFAQTLSLGTTNFHIDQVEDGYRIISIGKGSSLGMSMYGAGWKADQGNVENISLNNIQKFLHVYHLMDIVA